MKKNKKFKLTHAQKRSIRQLEKCLGTVYSGPMYGALLSFLMDASEYFCGGTEGGAEIRTTTIKFNDGYVSKLNWQTGEISHYESAFNE